MGICQFKIKRINSSRFYFRGERRCLRARFARLSPKAAVTVIRLGRGALPEEYSSSLVSEEKVFFKSTGVLFSEL